MRFLACFILSIRNCISIALSDTSYTNNSNNNTNNNKLLAKKTKKTSQAWSIISKLASLSIHYPFFHGFGLVFRNLPIKIAWMDSCSWALFVFIPYPHITLLLRIQLNYIHLLDQFTTKTDEKKICIPSTGHRAVNCQS